MPRRGQNIIYRAIPIGDLTGSPVGLIEDLLRVAEYKGALMYDMYEDNAINFKDYTVFANQYLDEILWP
jgi:hypothetical protein